jgi:hypothetical protein
MLLIEYLIKWPSTCEIEAFYTSIQSKILYLPFKADSPNRVSKATTIPGISDVAD